MKILYIGDPHVRPVNVEEWEKLAHFINNTILEKRPDRIVILGDLMHTHSVIRLEVLDFWDAWLDIFSETCDLFVLVGNHDQSGDYNKEVNALSVFNRLKKNTLHIIEQPQWRGVFGYMPYVHSEKEFIESANLLVMQGCKTLICHQTFYGSKYDNGMYAPDGFNPDFIECDLIISGHIHKRQRFGKVIYPGTSTWQTQSDANEDKGLWLVNHAENGSIVSEEFIDTSHVVTKIVSLEWKEGEPAPTVQDGVKTTIELIGSSQWANEQKKLLKGTVSIKTKITDKANKVERKTGKNFQDFMTNLYTTNVDRTKLLKYMRDNGIVG